MFGGSMKNVIFSIYTPIKDNSTRSNTYFSEEESISKAERSHTQFERHIDKLIAVKQEYAKQCNAEFVLFEDIDQQIFNDQFDSLNFYKHTMIEKLCGTFDNILYLDFDVVPMTNISFFDVHDMSVINVHAVNATKDNTWHIDAKQSKKSYQHIMNTHFDRYHMHCKAKCKLAMLLAHDIITDDYHVANTGIIGGSSKALSQIQMMDRMQECIDAVDIAVEEKMFGGEITQYFFANNETFYSYILDKYKIQWNNLQQDWHKMIFTKDENLNNVKLAHVINKDFEHIWSRLD